MPESKCVYSVVRFVHDPVRFEPRNIGVILQCPDLGYFDGLFTNELRRKLAGVAEAVDIEILEEYIADFRNKFAQARRMQSTRGTLFEPPFFLVKGFLEALSDNGYGKLLFTQPRGILSQDLSVDLQKLYERFVEIPKPVKIADMEKPSSDSRAFVESAFQERRLLRKGGVRSRYPVEVREHRFACDFGYRARREVLIEVVDLTSEVFQVRLQHFSPSAIKFKLVKEDRPNTSRIALLKTPMTSNGDLALEHSTLGEFSTDVIDLDKEKRKFAELLERVERDTTGTTRLFR